MSAVAGYSTGAAPTFAPTPIKHEDLPVSHTLAAYLPAFQGRESEPFLTHLVSNAEKRLVGTTFTRGEFWALGRKAAFVLRRAGLKCGDAHLHFFSGNAVADLAFRLGSVFLRTVPVTVNWEADTPERVLYKVKATKAKLVVTDRGTSAEQLAYLREHVPDLEIFEGEGLADCKDELPEAEFHGDLDTSAEAKKLALETTRIIIFTSGTTGDPKGVELPYRSYDTNRETFESFLEVQDPATPFTALVTNPMHHTNSTAITDWSLRRPGARLLYVQKYTTDYWQVLATAGCSGLEPAAGDEAFRAALAARRAEGRRVIAPLVSKHFDFLDSLVTSGKLPVKAELFREAVCDIVLLLGSAPVGPATVERLQRYCGCLPTVRFGSTETCLQVIGTLLCLPQEQRLRAFQSGWAHVWGGEAKCGYYIGRAHAGSTRAKVVKSTDRSSADYMRECAEGEPGLLVTEGGNLMTGYVGEPEKTAEVFDAEGWYTNLGDICYFLLSKDDGEKDFYWQGRDTAFLIKGGSNYSYEQINEGLKKHLFGAYGLAEDAFDVAVVGLRLQSEHEDDCIATIELKSDDAKARLAEIEASIMDKCKGLQKSNKPDKVRFAPIPRNFKGACEVKVLKKDCKGDIDSK